ncbi:Dihydrofolate reductase [Imhoffiella purpurea]|uniref:Dihydrofolate reductase n=1 Tax=Imhoffiella purpurea TaxID=1249627 RepID=W9VE78_9GAMM|nr:Dihydrofolate reductase [Imhoffiella purpurea]
MAAIADNGVIGRDNELPWRLPADLAHFKRLTLDRTLVMGRRTWESLPGLLPRRRHIVLSRDPGYGAEGCERAASLNEAIVLADGEPELMVVGGAALYAEALPRADRLCLTLVHTRAEGDVLFPEWDRAGWREVDRVERPADERNAFAMSFVEWLRLP